MVDCDELLEPGALDRIERKSAEIDDLRDEISGLHEQLNETAEEYRETVVNALYNAQEALDDGEELTLVESTEVTRGGHYTFREVLTPEGVVARDVKRRLMTESRGASPGEMYDWLNGNEEPLEIEEEYLTFERGRQNHLEKIGERLTGGEPGSAHFTYG